MIQRGSVIFDPDFEFMDGGHANKLFIVLNDPSQHTHAFVVLTTSQQAGHRKKDLGCQHGKKEFFMKSGKEFAKDTWLVLWRNPILLPLDILNKRIKEGICSIKQTLSEQRVNEIRNCVERVNEGLTREHCDMLGVKFRL